AFFLDGDREVALVRGGAHRVGARRLAAALEILEERREALEGIELVRVDGEEMAGEVLEAIVAGEEDEGGGVRRLDDDVGDHDLELFDASRGAFPRLGRHGPRSYSGSDPGSGPGSDPFDDVDRSVTRRYFVPA